MKEPKFKKLEVAVNILCCMGPKMLIMTDLVSLLTVPHLHGSPFQSCGSTGGQQEAGKLMVSVWLGEGAAGQRVGGKRDNGDVSLHAQGTHRSSLQDSKGHI